ncbi:MAG: HNH endonuclease, partial [Mycobacterium sp.]|nr:HNH endonuclease [Mycobacterium sp.]
DIDHTIPYPLGPTHPSNLKLLCRYHHLLKTFYTGLGGWADRQAPDGTVVWTAPTGHVYTTVPGGSIFFPVLASPTSELVLPTSMPSPGNDRGLMMPQRKRRRAEDRAYRITAERRINDERLAEERRKRAAWIAANYEPPPF